MYSKIILPLDGSAHAECALPHAEALAKGLSVKLVLLQVIPYPEVRDAGVEADWAAQGRQYMDGIAADLKTSGLNDVQVEVLWGEVYKEIIDYAQADENALIVMSTHGRTGLAKLTFGSVTEAVLREATAVPVMVCHCFAAPAGK
jgi:nucleotide-binding universal stress UspA family protein